MARFLSAEQEFAGVADSRVNIAIKQVLNFLTGPEAMLHGPGFPQVPTKTLNYLLWIVPILLAIWQSSATEA
jgi:hypothetical protein